MNNGLHLALTQMRHSARHLVAVCLATMIGVAFVAATLVVGNVLKGTISNAVAWQFDGASVIVTGPRNNPVDPALVEQVRTIDGVESAENRYVGAAIARSGTREVYPLVANVPQAASLHDAIRVKEGRLPSTVGEVAILPSIAKSLRVAVGDTITFEPIGGGASRAAIAQTVVGIVDAPDSLGGLAPDVFGWMDDATASQFGADAGAILIVASPGVSAQTVAHRVNDLLGTEGIARTYDEQAKAMAATVSGNVDILGFGLLAFAAIALFVAGIVIANTFTVLVTQRTRNLALLRCVGATKAQVRRSVLTEALGVGVLASVLGIVVGIGMLAIGLNAWVTYSGNTTISTDLALTPRDLVVPFILGVGATMIAAWGPSRGATRVAPLAALRPQTVLDLRAAASRWRVVFAVLLLGGGSLLLAGGVAIALGAPGLFAIFVGLLGGMISFFGIMVAGVLIVPRVVGMLARLLAPFGAPAAIAASNSVRNPKRTTATAMALLVAVTLITMMSVGAESSKATLDAAIAERNPVDLVIATGDLAMPESMMRIVESSPDVAKSMPVSIAQATLDGDGAGSSAGSGAEIEIQGVQSDLAKEITDAPDQLDELGPGVAIVPERIADDYGILDGETITLAGSGGSKQFRTRVTKLDDSRVTLDDRDRVQIAPDATVRQLWLKFSDGVNGVDATGRLQDADDGRVDLIYLGGAQAKAQNTRVLDTMLLIVTMLLGVAVVIALVGVGNTLSLSVIERTRESAVLRAMGLTRGQMRRMLALEGMLIALVGVVLGIALGIAYGVLGTLTLFGDTFGISLAIPWDRVAIIVAIGLLAGVIASVLPARAALKVSPVAALAE